MTPASWRPPGWQSLEEGEDLTLKANAQFIVDFEKSGHIVPGKYKRTNKTCTASDDEEITILLANVKRLRDAWNTYGPAWALAEALTGVPFVSDPFHNPNTQHLDSLIVRLDGSGDLEDDKRPMNGLAVSDEVVVLELPKFNPDTGEVEIEKLELPLPLNWHGHGEQEQPVGKCPVAANGPHSCVERWLKLCVAYGQRDICAAFVPDNGDGWFQRWALTAQLVVRLNRVPCSPPEGIRKSTPRGASALLIWVPKSLVQTLPKVTRDCITKGKNFKVPLINRPQSGVQYAFVQPGAVDKVVDFGLTS